MKIWRCGLLAAIAMMVFMGMGMTSMAQTCRMGQSLMRNIMRLITRMLLLHLEMIRKRC